MCNGSKCHKVQFGSTVNPLAFQELADKAIMGARSGAGKNFAMVPFNLEESNCALCSMPTYPGRQLGTVSRFLRYSAQRYSWIVEA